MKICIAINDANIIPIFYDRTGRKLNVLTSYHYLRGQAVKLIKMYRSMFALFYLDSGAFSASTGKSTITIEEYAQYLNQYGVLFDETFNLDDKFHDPDHNWQNQVYLETHLSKRIKRPIPVLHADDAFKEFETYYADYPYIAVGSNQKAGDAFFKKIKAKYPKLRVHMFGNLNRKMLLKHRPFSADSSSFAKEAGFGLISYWRPTDKKEYRVRVGEREKGDKKIPHFMEFKYRKELEAFLHDTLGYEYRDLLSKKETQWIVNLYFLTEFEKYVNSLPKS
jgi:hypothetical protein